jgi:glyceraldehyde 3-phosphate dehydrogenase
VSVVPTTTGAAKAVADVIPELKGVLDGFAWRVPIPDGSIVTFICELKKPTDAERINWLFQQVAQFHLKGIVEYCDEPIVSRDVIRNPSSCVLMRCRRR